MASSTKQTRRASKAGSITNGSPASRRPSPTRIARNDKGQAKAKLNSLGIDEVCSDILAGASLTSIAAALGVGLATLVEWLAADPERSARARAARALAAIAWDEEAERLLREATDGFALSKAKEIAHHLRWRASKISPSYSEKAEIRAAPVVRPLTVEAGDQSATMQCLREMLEDADARADRAGL